MALGIWIQQIYVDISEYVQCELARGGGAQIWQIYTAPISTRDNGTRIRPIFMGSGMKGFFDNRGSLIQSPKEKEEEKKQKKNTVLVVLAVVGGIVVLAAVAYAVYRFFFQEKCENEWDEFDDGFEEDFFEEEYIVEDEVFEDEV